MRADSRIHEGDQLRDLGHCPLIGAESCVPNDRGGNDPVSPSIHCRMKSVHPSLHRLFQVKVFVRGGHADTDSDTTGLIAGMRKVQGHHCLSNNLDPTPRSIFTR